MHRRGARIGEQAIAQQDGLLRADVAGELAQWPIAGSYIQKLVGERWLSGRWTISEEHLASRTLGRVLASLGPAAAAAAT